MVTKIANTAHTNATSPTDSESKALNPANEMLYNLSLTVAKMLLKNNLITANEYAEIDTILRRKFTPTLSAFIADNT